MSHSSSLHFTNLDCGIVIFDSFGSEATNAWKTLASSLGDRFECEEGRGGVGAPSTITIGEVRVSTS